MLISRSSSEVDHAMAVPQDARVPHDSERALRVFRDAVAHLGRDVAEIEELRTPLQQFCLEARHERMPPEQVLICVKRALDGLVAYGDIRLSRRDVWAGVPAGVPAEVPAGGGAPADVNGGW